MKSASLIATMALLLATQSTTTSAQTEHTLSVRPQRLRHQQQQQSILTTSPTSLPNGTPCNKDTTCQQCLNESSFWTRAGQQRCGPEPAPALIDGTPCIPYGSCQQCQHGYGVGDDDIFRCGVVTTESIN